MGSGSYIDDEHDYDEEEEGEKEDEEEAKDTSGFGSEKWKDLDPQTMITLTVLKTHLPQSPPTRRSPDTSPRRWKSG